MGVRISVVVAGPPSSLNRFRSDALARLADELAAHDLRYYQDEAPAISVMSWIGTPNRRSGRSMP